MSGKSVPRLIEPLTGHHHLGPAGGVDAAGEGWDGETGRGLSTSTPAAGHPCTGRQREQDRLCGHRPHLKTTRRDAPVHPSAAYSAARPYRESLPHTGMHRVGSGLPALANCSDLAPSATASGARSAVFMDVCSDDNWCVGHALANCIEGLWDSRLAMARPVWFGLGAGS